MSAGVGFLPTAFIPRVHPALARLWRSDLSRRRLDAIFLSRDRLPMAEALGWGEFGELVEVPGGWTHADTLAEYGRACDVRVLLPGDAAIYANCLRAAEQIGSPTWCSWQQSGPKPAPLGDGRLVAEFEPCGDPDWASQGSFDEFWQAVDRDERFTWILRLDAIGDVLLTLAWLLPFKKRYPRRRVGLVVRPQYVAWLRSLDWIDAVCGCHSVFWDELVASLPPGGGEGTAWINLMPGMLRTIGNRLLNETRGIAASIHPDARTRCGYSTGRLVTGQRELLGLIFDGVEPEFPAACPATRTVSFVWFSPYPGADERLWPPDCWAAALAPLRGTRIVLQPATAPVHVRWEAEFLELARAGGLAIERGPLTGTIIDLAKAMAPARGWVGVNSAPMHVAGLLGLPALALGLGWESNARWLHPSVQIVAAEDVARELQFGSGKDSLLTFARRTHRDDGWADGLYLEPETFAAVSAEHYLARI